MKEEKKGKRRIYFKIMEYSRGKGFITAPNKSLECNFLDNDTRDR